MSDRILGRNSAGKRL